MAYDRKKILIISLIAAGIVIFLIFILPVIIAPLAVSWLIAYFFAPVVDKLQKVFRNRSVSIIVLFILIIIIIGLFFMIILPGIVNQVNKAKEKIPHYQDTAKEYIGKLFARLKERYPKQYDEVWNKSIALIQQQMPRFIEPIAKFFYEMFSSFINFIISLLNIIIIPVVAFYWLKDYREFNEKVVMMVPIRYRAGFIDIVKEIDEVLGNFLRGQFIVSLILACIYTIGLSILGVPMAAVIGLVAGLANMVPYLGLVVGVLPASILSLMEYRSISHLIWTISVFIIGQLLEGTIIGPKIVGKKVNVHPILVIFAVLVGGTLFGFVGMIIAVPVTAIAMVLFRRVSVKYKASTLYKGDGGGAGI